MAGTGPWEAAEGGTHRRKTQHKKFYWKGNSMKSEANLVKVVLAIKFKIT